MSNGSLFDTVVQACDLGMVGPFALRRMLRRVGVLDPGALSLEDLERALPHVDEVLRLYLPPEVASVRSEQVRLLLREAASRTSSPAR
jgi:hypothetical protein